MRICTVFMYLQCILTGIASIRGRTEDSRPSRAHKSTSSPSPRSHPHLRFLQFTLLVCGLGDRSSHWHGSVRPPTCLPVLLQLALLTPHLQITSLYPPDLLHQDRQAVQGLIYPMYCGSVAIYHVRCGRSARSRTCCAWTMRYTRKSIMRDVRWTLGLSRDGACLGSQW